MSFFINIIISIFSIFRLFDPNLLKSKKLGDSFKETEIYEKGFSKHYKKYLSEKVIKFETERILALKKARNNAFFCVPIMVLIPFVIPYINWYSIFGENSFEIVFCILFLFYGLLSYFITNSMNLYQQTIKTEIFPNILNFFGEFQYNHETQKSAGSYEYSGLIPNYQRETSEDHMYGTYKGVTIDLFETELEKRVRTKDRSYYKTVFKGIMITLSMNKKFKAKNKGSDSNYDPVTIADKKFEKFIRTKISKRFPQHSIIGEEFGLKNKKSDYSWVIDPIDGTRSFVIGYPSWSNLIAFCYKNKPIMGLANFPILNKFYINALLSNPKTHAINMTSNAIMALIRPMEQYMGGVLSMNKNARIEAISTAAGIIKYYQDSFIMAREAFKKSDSILDRNNFKVDFFFIKNILPFTY